MVFKTKKTKKSKKWRGDTTYGHGARKKWKGSGHHGGVGMAGTGKRADHKKSLVIKLYGNNYFGKQGITSRKTERNKSKQINIADIQNNLDNLMKKYGKNNVLELKKYKILGEGELKSAVKIKAKGFSESAKEKIEKSGGEAILVQVEHKRKAEEKVSSKEEKPVIKKVVLKKKK
jgi:large subunit ribosomal protein L15